MVVSKVVYFCPYFGKWSNLTRMFETGWNHQLVMYGGVKSYINGIVLWAIFRIPSWTNQQWNLISVLNTAQTVCYCSTSPHHVHKISQDHLWNHVCLWKKHGATRVTSDHRGELREPWESTTKRSFEGSTCICSMPGQSATRFRVPSTLGKSFVKRTGWRPVDTCGVTLQPMDPRRDRVRQASGAHPLFVGKQ